MEWSKIAPKRADWDKLAEVFKAAGYPVRWVNGIPTWDKKIDDKLIESIVSGKKVEKKKK